MASAAGGPSIRGMVLSVRADKGGDGIVTSIFGGATDGVELAGDTVDTGCPWESDRLDLFPLRWSWWLGWGSRGVTYLRR